MVDRMWWTLVVVVLAGCASGERNGEPASPAQSRALIQRLMPSTLLDREGWAVDIYAAFAAMKIPASPQNACAVMAVAEQESGLRADPAVPGLPAIAWKAIDERAERGGVPKFLVHAALQLSSPDGRSYAERIDHVKTEKDLSDIFEDFIGMVPVGRRLFAGYNPVRTAGPMQVGIAFAERYEAGHRNYPYNIKGGLRDEVFTRRGGLFFGVAHLLDYPAAYDRMIYRFADFNAGQYASRNAAFQNALAIASGTSLDLDGDLVRRDSSDSPGSTELAARSLAGRLSMKEEEIRRTLEQEDSAGFERSPLYERVFALAERAAVKQLPRSLIPRIRLQSPKITRSLTTEWFANRVEERYQRCLRRAGD
ncbi:MAG TPA: DUF1615 domain-containing protein [Burkholderiaceae bacterium]|nr:DUF1615 domain-containing protein [Burkholderiaceae bacterium]